MSLFDRARARGADAPPALWRWLQVLWVCRVAAVSAVGGGLVLASLPESRDLFADTGFAWWQWTIFLFLIVAWATIVHLAARRALQYDDWHPAGRSGLSPERRERLRQEFRAPALWLPLALALLVFVFVLVAMGNAHRNLADAAAGLPPAREAASLIVLLIVTIGVAAVAYAIAAWFGPRLTVRLAGTVMPDPPLLAGKVPLFALVFRPAELGARWRDSTRLEQAAAVAGVLATSVFALVVLDPPRFADWLPRLLFLPVLVAGGVFLAGEIAALSHRVRVPLFLVLAIVSVGLTFWFDRHHDVRWTAAPPQGRSAAVGPTRQISFAEAVRRWRIANDCADPAPPGLCPDPIVIAAGGGAGRAAFQTATLVGALLDLDRLDVERRRYANIRNRIFALTTAPGSSVGAVVIRATLTDALERGRPDKPPCRAAPATAWWGATTSGRAALDPALETPFNPTHSWRDCFQLLLAGDSLLPVIAGLAIRDTFPVGNPTARRARWGDRATLLEQAFERRYGRITGMGTVACRRGLASGLCRRLGYHPEPLTADAWVPLLFINGTSAATGRRILASDVKAEDIVAPGRAAEQRADDVFALRSSRPAGSRPDPREADADLLLSTAATLGARFPLISPPRAIRDRTGDVVDRFLPGADVERAGLATAAGIVRLLGEAGTRPLVIRIGKEPIGNASAADLQDAVGDPNRLVDIAVRPITAATGPLCRHPSRARGSMRVAATSWWMSQPAQAYLDAQLCVEENWERLVVLLKNTRGPKLAPWMYEGSSIGR